MRDRIKRFVSGLNFRFIMLAAGIVFALLFAQLAMDTVADVRQLRAQRMADAFSVTNLISGGLSKRFANITEDDVSDIESMLANIRMRPDILQISVVDRKLVYFIDGDPNTDPIANFNYNDLQLNALRTGRIVYETGEGRISVGEPIMVDGTPAGAVLVQFANPGGWAMLWSLLGFKLISAVPILITAIFFAIGLSGQVTRALGRFSAVALRVADGGRQEPMALEGPREFRQFAETFNTMMSKFKHNIDQVYELAFVDRITQLPNREFFRMELTRAINRTQRNGTAGALLFVDLDGFKHVNDSLGHDMGDKLLAGFAERVQGIIRVEDTITWNASDIDRMDREQPEKSRQVLARLGGDEFTVLLAEIREETDAATVARRLISAVNEPFEIGGTEVRIGASVGIATFPRDGNNAAQVLKSADMAMYLAKEEGKNTYRFFSEELNARASRRIVIESQLRTALALNQLELYFQPKVEAESGRLVSVEALLRWNHPDRGVLAPAEFIGVAEETGLIQPIGEWVLKSAFRHIQGFERAGLDVSVSVNIAAKQFEQADFAARVLEMINEVDLDAAKLEMEITEEMAMSNPRRTLDHMRRLKRAGVRFAIDDFGTGYSNLSQLSRLPFDAFKIDRSFVEALDEDIDPNGAAIVRTILAMAVGLGYESVGEGVETEEQQKFLTEAGCTLLQGHLFARAMPAPDLVNWARDREARPEPTRKTRRPPRGRKVVA